MASQPVVLDELLADAIVWLDHANLSMISNPIEQVCLDRLIHLVSWIRDARGNHSHNQSDRYHLVEQLSHTNAYLNSMWERMHYFPMPWAEIITKSAYPELYSIAAALQAALCLEIAEHSDGEEELSYTIKAVEACDMGILMGRRDSFIISSVLLHDYLSKMASGYHRKCYQIHSQRHDEQMPAPRKRLREHHMRPKLPYNAFKNNSKVLSMQNPSLSDFYATCLLTSTPALITNAIEDWPSISDTKRSWQDIDNLRESKHHGWISNFFLI
jgi:hypothetical protein